MAIRKRCTHCRKIKWLSKFGPSKGRSLDKRQSWCRACCSALTCAWQRANPEYCRARSIAWNSRNKPKLSKYRKLYAEKNRAHLSAREAAYQAAKLRAIPLWADARKTERIYDKAAKLGLVVDHIVPLRSKVVCGLHWHRNLRAISVLKNSSKGNRFWPDMP